MRAVSKVIAWAVSYLCLLASPLVAQPVIDVQYILRNYNTQRNPALFDLRHTQLQFKSNEGRQTRHLVLFLVQTVHLGVICVIHCALHADRDIAGATGGGSTRSRAWPCCNCSVSSRVVSIELLFVR